MKKIQHFIQQWDELQAFLKTSVDELRERVETLVEAHREAVDDTVDLERDINWPSTYMGWDIIDMNWCGTYLRVEYRHCIPYDDHENYTTLIIDPEWWEMSDGELLRELLNRIKFRQKERQWNDVRQMRDIAEEHGYDVVKK